MYSCKLYYGTGFDTINIPDSPSVLQQAHSETVDDLDIVQDKHLKSIRINKPFSELEGVDYLQINDEYYIVLGITMLNDEVSELALQPDYLTSNGGIYTLEVEDGWTNRYCVESYNDNLFQWTIEEPFTPNEPLEIEGPFTVYDCIGNVGAYPEWTIITSTIQLEDLGRRKSNQNEHLDALWFKADTNNNDTNNSVIVPALPYAGTDYTTTGLVWIPNKDPAERVIRTTGTPGVVYYAARGTDRNSNNLYEGITVARSAGVESCILNQYVVPEAYIDTEYTELLGDTDTRIVQFCGIRATVVAESLPYEYMTTLHNKKCFCGKFNSYTLCSNVSGNKCEVLPEDIGGAVAPYVSVMSDVRPTGKPTAFFTYYKGSVNTLRMLAVDGLEWQNAPLIYTDKSGSTIDRYNFNSQFQQKSMNYGIGQASRVVRAASSAFGGASEAGLSYDKGITESTFLHIGRGFSIKDKAPLIGTIAGLGSHTIDIASSYANYNIDKNRDIFNFTASQNLVIPEINFPRNEGLRDYIGNNFYLYKYRLSQSDIRRYDRFLTMYGYAVSIPFEKSQLATRPYFNYISVAGACLKYRNVVSMSYRLGAEEQLSSGVRLWHVLPDERYYTEGNEVNE